MRTGKIKNYIPSVRYGFIVADDGENIFFHASTVKPRQRPIGAGMRVKFEDEFSEEHRSRRATVVEVIEGDRKQAAGVSGKKTAQKQD
jgi:cold shock CspA family protein